MLAKLVIVIAVATVAYGANHPYSVSTVIKHEEPKHGSHSGGVGHGHAISTQTITSHGGASSHGLLSGHSVLGHGSLVQESGHGLSLHGGSELSSLSHENHGHAISSQSIVTHSGGHSSEGIGSSYQHSSPIQPIYTDTHSSGISSQNYVQHSSGHGQSNIGSYISAPIHEIESSHSLGHGVSSQNIILESGHGHGLSGSIVSSGLHGLSSGSLLQGHSLSSHGSIEQSSGLSGGIIGLGSYSEGGHGHAVSSQSIVRHDSQGHGHQGIESSYHSIPLQQSHSSIGSHGHAVSSQNLIQHSSLGHKQQSISYQPIISHLGNGIEGISSGHGSHGHAVSSQSIVQLGHNVGGHEQGSYQVVGGVSLSGHEESHHEEYYAHPKYEFSYSVKDPHTHDIKSQHESRDGDVVKGVYSLHESDGTIRTVEYSADKHSGFNALVKKSGHSQHIESHH